MQKSETATILAFAQGIDGRDFSEQSVEAWHQIIGGLPFDAALAAAKIHYQRESRRLFPADILGCVTGITAPDRWMYPRSVTPRMAAE